MFSCIAHNEYCVLGVFPALVGNVVYALLVYGCVAVGCVFVLVFRCLVFL